MPNIYLSAADGYSVQLTSNNQSTIIAWFDEWVPRLADPEYPLRMWVTSPVFGDSRNLTEPDWSCDTRFLGIPLEIRPVMADGTTLPGVLVHSLLMQHGEYIKELVKADDYRRGKNVR